MKKPSKSNALPRVFEIFVNDKLYATAPTPIIADSYIQRIHSNFPPWVRIRLVDRRGKR